MKYVCEPDKCISCDTKIHIRGESFAEKVARGVYKEMTLDLSNGSKMRVGICDTCHKNLESIDMQEVLEAIKARWRATIKAGRKEILESQIKDLKVLA